MLALGAAAGAAPAAERGASDSLGRPAGTSSAIVESGAFLDLRDAAIDRPNAGSLSNHVIGSSAAHTAPRRPELLPVAGDCRAQGGMDDDDELVGLLSAQPVAMDMLGGDDDDDDLGWLQTAPSQTQLRSPYVPAEAAGGDADAEAAHLERLAQEGEDADAEAALAEAEGAAPGTAKTTRVSLDAFASRARPRLLARASLAARSAGLTRPPRARQRPRSARAARRRHARLRLPDARRRRRTTRRGCATAPRPRLRPRRRLRPPAACARHRSTTAWTWTATAYRVRV